MTEKNITSVAVSAVAQVAKITKKSEKHILKLHSRTGIPVMLLPDVLELTKAREAKLGKVAELLIHQGKIRFSLDRIHDIYDVRDNTGANVGYVAQLLEQFYDLEDGDADYISEVVKEIDGLVENRYIYSRKEFLMMGRARNIEHARELIEYMQTEICIES